MLLTAFGTAFLIIMLLFFIIERKGLRLSVMLPVVVMTSAASIGRVIFAFIPNVQPVTVIVVIMGMCCCTEAGFLTGALSALVSSLIMGFGPWTLWQMLAWGLIGIMAGLLGKIKIFSNTAACAVISFISAFIFSAVMDIWTVSTIWDYSQTAGAVLSVFASGFLFNIPHSVFNVLLAVCIFAPMKRKLGRINAKYSAV